MAKNSNKGTGTATATEKAPVKRRGMSAESRLKLSLNDVLHFAKEQNPEAYASSPEIQQAESLLESLGFAKRQSSAQRIAELQEELQTIDITSADSQRRINEISKEIGKLRRV